MPDQPLDHEDRFVPQRGPEGRLRIAPTDVATFVSMDQCQRALRLRLDEGNRTGGNPFKDYGVRKQQIAPIRSRQGRLFEEEVEQQLGATSLAGVQLSIGAGASGSVLTSLAAALEPGGERLYAQAQITAVVGAWDVNGVADLVRLRRSAAGELTALIVDIKASPFAKVEHRLQVAFYERMLREAFAAAGVPLAEVEVGVLYRGGLADAEPVDPVQRARLDRDRNRAQLEFGVNDLYLEVVDDLPNYREDVDRFVFGEDSTAAKVAVERFADLPYHVEAKCDTCVFGEVCVKWTQERRDLSLVPFMTADQKQALWEQGIRTVGELAALMPRETEPRRRGPNRVRREAVPAHRPTVQRLNTVRSIGPDLDTLVFRAQALEDATSGGQPFARGGGLASSLPACSPERHPNLVTVYLDAQVDPMTDRLFMLGARVAAAKDGEVTSDRVATVVQVADAPVETSMAEESLLLDWVEGLLRTVSELAAPDAAGERKAPVHLVLWSGRERDLLLAALGRHADKAQGSTSLALFLDPTAATGSPTLTLLRDDVRATRELPLWFQTLQSVAAVTKSETGTRFDWSDVRPVFRERFLDAREAFAGPGGERSYRDARPRFSSDVPAEYAYAAWGELDEVRLEGHRGDVFAPYRKATMAGLVRLAELRVAALQHVARILTPDREMEKAPWAIPALAELVPPQASLARALKEFLLVERTLEVGAWKAARSAPAEERMLAGVTLRARYHEADQDEEFRERNRAYLAWYEPRQARLLELRAVNPAATLRDLGKDPENPEPPGVAGMTVRLRLESGADLSDDEALALTELRRGSWAVVAPEWWPPRPGEEQEPRVAPRPSNLLKAMRGTITSLPEPGDSAGTPMVELVLKGFGGASPPFTFLTTPPRFLDGEVYTLDEDAGSPAASQVARAVGRVLGEDGKPPDPNTLVARLEPTGRGAEPRWSPTEEAGQRRFLAGLDAMVGVNGFHPIAGHAVRAYIGGYGDSGLLLVQGPPGTGKSYSTAFAVLARMQGAIDAGAPCRVMLCANTHAATNVLLDKVVEVLGILYGLRETDPDRFREHFREELLRVPVFRLGPNPGAPDGVVVLPKHEDRPADPETGRKVERATKVIREFDHAIVGGTPGAVSDLFKDLKIGSNQFFDRLVLDEASRMTLPEAVLAASGLRPEGAVIVVGDHRQMQPIRSKAWEEDPRQAWQETAPFESAYDALRSRRVDELKLEESFRLHAHVADFLQDQVYAQDHITFHSRKTMVLPAGDDADPFVAAVLEPAHPLVVVVHGEQRSQLRNDFEAELTQRIIAGVLGRPEIAGKGSQQGYGVVVPHRSQRARIGPLLQALVGDDPEERRRAFEAVDTVERFQGGERDMIVINATESDPAYLLNSGGFLYEPTRLTVALSRARLKLVLIASSSVFGLFSPDPTLHEHIRLWRNLLRDYCTKPLWAGEVGHAAGTVPVRVLGNVPRSLAVAKPRVVGGWQAAP